MIRLKSPRAAAFALLFTMIFVVSSQELYAQSARSRGMGGAFIGLSDDESATYYNPAGLSQIQGTEASFQGKVNETDTFDWKGMAFTGHIYEDTENNTFSITDYLEHNILEEPIPRKPKYSYGISYNTGELSEKYYENTFLRGSSRETKDIQLAFAARFPVARKMTANEELYAGIKINHHTSDIKAAIDQERKVLSLGLGLMYHYNDKITGGITLDNLVQSVKATNGGSEKKDDIIFNLGAAMQLSEGTTVSADVVNITDSPDCRDAVERQFRIGVEKKFTENDLTLRMGSHNGTLTLGFGMNLLPNLRVDYAYYDGGENIDNVELAEHYIGAHMTFD